MPLITPQTMPAPTDPTEPSNSTPSRSSDAPSAQNSSINPPNAASPTNPTYTPEIIAFATRMYDAARQGRLDVFQQALPAGLPANMTNDKGDSLLMLSAYHGHTPLVRLLLQHNANPNQLNDRGQSPLAGAVFKNEEGVIEALLEGGADPDVGRPSAMEAVGLFGAEGRWGERFRGARGRGRGRGGVGDGGAREMK